MRNSFVIIARLLRRTLLASAVFALSALPAFAQQNADPYGLAVGTAAGLATGDIRAIVARIINGFLGLLGIIAVSLVMYAGYLWMTSNGDETKVQKAKDLLKNAVIGMLIIVSAYAIAFFVMKALTNATGNGTTGCEGEGPCNVYDPFNPVGGPGSFRVQSISPSGSGGERGAAKNSVVQVVFTGKPNMNIGTDAGSALSPNNIIVRQCNPRRDGDDLTAFDKDACGGPIVGTLTKHNDHTVWFKPSANVDEEELTYFTGEFWYKVTVAPTVKNQTGVSIYCPATNVDISSEGVPSDYCARAFGVGLLVDKEAPTVSIDAPNVQPPLCASVENGGRTELMATGKDDFLLTNIDFSLDGSTERLFDGDGIPKTTASNPAAPPEFPYTVFYANDVFANLAAFANVAALEPGSHEFSVIAYDGAGQMGTASRDVNVLTSTCCNLIKDEGESEVDCGGTSSCGACAEGPCTEDADCRSGACDEATKKCQEPPSISGVNPTSGGPGTMVTITGTGFGGGNGREGAVVFLGDPQDDSDDVTAAPCAPQAWSATQVVIAVPSGAVDGPLKLIATNGLSDRTDDTANGSTIPAAFNVTDTVSPGICYLDPSSGGPATKFSVHGSGFGSYAAPVNGTSVSLVSFGVYALLPNECLSGSSECGWLDDRTYVTAPSNAQESLYQVRVKTATSSSNPAGFIVRSPVEANPRIESIVPANGPVGSYVTINGTGFGTRKGIVHFKYKNPNDANSSIMDAPSDPPVCADNWHDDYIIVKVPPSYTNGGEPMALAPHQIVVETIGPTRTSKEVVNFTVDTSTLRPGICAMDPDNGLPGSHVRVTGEGFGSGVANSGNDPGPGANTARYSVLFYKSQSKKCVNNDADCSALKIGDECENGGGACSYASLPATQYGSWEETVIDPHVSGTITDKTTWPSTGPVFVVSENILSANAIKFKVQDCNATGAAACAVGKVCCTNGSCQASCGPELLDSAYGWRFSTEVLPVMPQVAENRSCSVTSTPPRFQSPSPFKDTVDACVNAQLHVAFTLPLNPGSFQAANNDANATVILKECTGELLSTCTVPVPLVSFANSDFANCIGTGQDKACRSVNIGIDPSYNANAGIFKKNTRYKLTLVSNPSASKGVKEVGASGRYLDGDFNNIAGGDYVMSFRTRNSDEPCQISMVGVDAPKQTIDNDQESANFSAVLMAGNCNQIVCDPANGPKPATLTWSVVDEFLQKETSISPYCDQPVKAKKEVADTVLGLQAKPTGASTNPVLNGASHITVAFADPRVVSVFPKPECDAACINAEIGAVFNIDMATVGSGAMSTSNVTLNRCRNQACNPPFVPVANGVYPSVGYDAATRTMTIGLMRGSGEQSEPVNLEPNTYYTVRIKGVGGVKSASGVELTGLNSGDYYAWKFKTKDDPNICLPDRTEVTPAYTLLKYAGARADLKVTPFGSPDSCNAAGQRLNPLSYGGWNWDVDPSNAAIQGFFNASSQFVEDILNVSTAAKVDRAPSPKPGCTDRCLLAGSQNKIPQCGNGKIESQFEECDKVNGAFPSWCSSINCRFLGTATVPGGTCGNGTTDAGEACDKVDGAFPPGCKDPAAAPAGLGCYLTGSSTAPNAKCGDGLIQDGEACDDRNAQNGDGCSAECLHEGTAVSCGAFGTTPPPAGCVNFCGNGVVETGEDPRCESASGVAAGCDAATCLKQGTSPCRASSCMAPTFVANVCGNGVTEPGEDADCDNSDGVSKYCTEACLLKGSSSKYKLPSFCGDAVDGRGEYHDTIGGVSYSCEATAADGKIDPAQSVSVKAQDGQNVSTTVDHSYESRVKAGVTGVADGKMTRAVVALEAACQSSTNPAAFCDAVGAANGLSLGCAADGTCVPRPTVTSIQPTSFAACRNAQVTVAFSQMMDENSVKANLLVGYDNGDANCPTGTVQIGFSSPDTRGFWAKLWSGIVGAFNDYVLRPVFGAPPQPPTSGTKNNKFCSIAGTVTTVLAGQAAMGTVPDTRHTVAHFAPTSAMPAKKYIRVFVGASAKSVGGVNMTTGGFTQYFATGGDVCAVTAVRVVPAYVMLPSATAAQNVTAHALDRQGQAIVPTTDYAWTWQWTPTASTSPIVISPVTSAGSACTLPSACTDANGCKCITPRAGCMVDKNGTRCMSSVGECVMPSDTPTCATDGGCLCQVALASCTVATGASSCTSSVSTLTSVAQVSARNVSGVTGRASDGPVPVEASAIFGTSLVAGTCEHANVCNSDNGCICSQSGHRCTIAKGNKACKFADVISSLSTTDTGYALVLCPDPWPKFQSCNANNRIVLPWDQSNPIEGCTGPQWHPFSDPVTDTKFYYCRSVQKTGADAEPLPCLKEAPARVSQVGPGILNEFLFTFDNSSANCPEAPSSTGAGWSDDAIGLRVSKNTDHVSVSDWYSLRGFRGNPQPAFVDGYDALQEGRTTYVNVGGKSSVDDKLFTNVNTFSYNDSAAPETVAVFGQILANVNFTATPDMADIGLCRTGRYRSNRLFRCATNEDCRVDAFGKPVASQSTYTCDVGRSVCQRPSGNSVADVDGIGRGISCTKDMDCRVDASGAAIQGRVNGSCDVPKTKLIRDVKRWADLQDIRAAAIAKLNSSGKIPTLDAGSFVRGRTVSAWPSWSTTFMGELGVKPPTDPVNLHGICGSCTLSDVCADAAGCSCSLGTSTCTVANGKTACPLPNFDPATCWSVSTGIYVTPTRSLVYGYETIGPTDFELESIFEFGKTDSDGDDPVWSGTTCVELPETLNGCNSNPAKTWSDAGNLCALVNGKCNYKVGKLSIRSYAGPFSNPPSTASSSGAGRCGDGVVNDGEDCEPGQTDAATCNANGRTGTRVRSCKPDCDWEEWPTCNVGVCGDGIIQPPEPCDDGANNGKYGFCNAGCTGRGFMCGDGTVQPGEKCDCGDKNGQYNINGKLNTATNASACVSGSSSASAPSCAWDCGSAGPRCGDGIVNGSETQCDGGSEEWKGYCSTTTHKGCNADTDCPTGQTCGHFCPQPEQKQRHTCNTNSSSSTDDDADACKWGTWTCSAPGDCGNGKKETGEQCDDGNADNTDSCTTSCRTPVCGDGFTQPSTAEFCDQGSANNTKCVPEYGKSCTYCTASCKTASISGAFCGDGAVQSASSTVQGPEECDQSIDSEWICMDRSIEWEWHGRRLESPVCSQCKRKCELPGAELCQMTKLWNGSFGPDYDGDGETDNCDPDDDQDGVPDGYDCDAYDDEVHGAYDRSGPAHAVGAASEQCDGKDNNCDGSVDNYLNVRGTVLDARTNKGMEGASVEVYCASSETSIVKKDITPGSGAYSFNQLVTGNCSGNYKIVAKKGAKGDMLCTQGTTKNVSCTEQGDQRDAGEMFVSDRPEKGQLRLVLFWDDDTTDPNSAIDVDLKMSSASKDGDGNWVIGPKTDYVNRSVQDPNPSAWLSTLDIDSGYDRFESGSREGEIISKGGPETITAMIDPAKKYAFFTRGSATSNLTTRAIVWMYQDSDERCESHTIYGKDAKDADKANSNLMLFGVSGGEIKCTKGECSWAGAGAYCSSEPNGKDWCPDI